LNCIPHTATSSAYREVISQAVDDRTPAERNAINQPAAVDVADVESLRDDRMAGGGVRPLSKSRYSSVSLFIAKPRSAQELAALASLNDISADVDEEAYKVLVEDGLDHPLAMHVAHLFVRDPLVIFSDSIELDNASSMVLSSSSTL
jgi:glutamate--cysteine ligase catalytic subunit